MFSATGHTFRVILMIILTGFNLKGQTFNPRYNFKQLNVQNGLVQNIVYHFLQDGYGYMWIGTHNGITLYDGTRTINFLHNEEDSTSLGGNFITCLLEDSSQQVWIGNENGIDLYIRSSNTFTHFAVDRPDGSKEKTYCVPLGFYTATELWFLDTKTKSIQCLNIKTKRTNIISGINSSNALFYRSPQTKDIHIWSSYDKGTIHQVYKNNKLIDEQTFFSGKNKSLGPELIVLHVLQQNDTTVWLSTNKGLVKLNPVTNKYEIFDHFQDRIVRELRFTAISNKGELWAASGPDGIYVFNIKTKAFIDNFRNDKFDPFSVCSNNIVSLYFDKTNNAWCGSYGNGISYTNTENNLFTSYLSKKEAQAWNGNNHISLMGTNPKGNIWCTFENTQKVCFLDKNFEILRYDNILREDGTNFDDALYGLLFETNDEAWCITNKGLFLYNIHTNKLRPVKYELLNDEVQGSIWIHDILRLNDNSLVFSTFAGLYHLIREAGKISIEPVIFLKNDAYSGFGRLFQDRSGLIYVKDLGDYLYILKPSNNNKGYQLVKSVRFVPEINQFFNSKTDTVVYIASDDGLYHIDMNSLQIKKEAFSSKMPFLNISSGFKRDGKFWIFGEKGLYSFDEKNNVGRTFTIEDGLPANEFSPEALALGQNNQCIAGTSNGLVSFFPDQLKYSSYSPRPQLTGIYINDALYASAPNPNEVKKLDLSFRENTFSFDFSTIAFNNTADYSFEYMLDRYDETWIKSGAANYTRYSKIPPGKYTFNLRVIDSQGKVSPYSKSLEIEIAKSFWQTNFFRALLAAFIFFIGWLFLKWYSNQKIKAQKREFEKQQLVEKERTRIATDMHDDLGAGLSRIKFLSETIGIKKQREQSIEEDISKIREYSHAMIDKMGEIVWALNEKNDSLSDLLSYTRVYAMEYLAQNGINCIVEAPEHFPSNFVNGEFRRNVYLTVKEALHNVVKHAQASFVSIQIHANEKLEFVIRDNGIGFDKKNIRAFSNGLMNMEKRIKEIGGEFTILNENGTTIRIKVSLPT
ncbi:MAG: two-component regulator propeller domain-containing protein [Bacteroidota bacterium]